MKIAYLILAHNNWRHLERLLAALNADEVSFFIHIDKKATADASFSEYNNVKVLTDRVTVNWGGYSLVEAEFRLLKAAHEADNFDYYVLLSGVDYPIRSNRYIQSFFTKNKTKNFINVVKIPQNVKKYERLDTYHIEGGARNNKLKRYSIGGINVLIGYLPFKRGYPKRYAHFNLYAGSTWWAFHRDFVGYLLNYRVNNPHFFNFYKHARCPSEMIFQTIIMNSPFRESVDYGLTYDDWAIAPLPHPALIGEIHLPILRQELIEVFYSRIINHTAGKKLAYGNLDLEEALAGAPRGMSSPHLFARKFNDVSDGILKQIEDIRNIQGF